MSKGILYIMTTSVEGLIKIGKTQNFNNRMVTLEQNGYWNVSGLKRFFAVKVDDYDEKEKLIHTVFSKSQVSSSELFALDKNIAKDMLEAFEGEQIYPEVKTSNLGVKENTLKETKKIRKPATFEMLNIPIGSELVFILDKTKKVITIDNKSKVQAADGTIMALTPMADYLANRNISMTGFQAFTYNDKNLWDIRLELENK